MVEDKAGGGAAASGVARG